MNETNNTYVPNAIDPAILSVLDVELDGKVVTAETWKSLWNLVITHVNSIDAYLVTIEQFRIEWEQGIELFNTIVEEFRVKYEALASSFIHYGVDEPTNEHIQLWCEPVRNVQDYGFIMATSVNYRGYFPLGEIVLNDTLRTGLYSITKGSTFVFKQDTTELLESVYTAASHGLLIVAENENSTHTEKITQFIFYGILTKNTTANEINSGVYSAHIKKTLSSDVWVAEASDFYNMVETDQAYSPTSTNPQSGTATAQGIAQHNAASNTHQDIRTAVSAKQDKTDNTLQTIDKTVVGGINEVNAIAKEAKKAKSNITYQALITELNSAAKTAYNVGQDFYIQTKNVPDLWVMSIENSSVPYTYTTDEQFIADTAVQGGCRVGYFKLAQLETQKIDLSGKQDKFARTYAEAEYEFLHFDRDIHFAREAGEEYKGVTFYNHMLPKFDDVNTRQPLLPTEDKDAVCKKYVDEHHDSEKQDKSDNSLQTTDKTVVGAINENRAYLNNVVMHRNIFRGKNLGTSVTDAQKTAIQNGTFEDLYVGDYWEKDGIKWTIADIDYWYNADGASFTQHHLVIVPASSLYNAVVNDNYSTAGGYALSKMRTQNLEQARTLFTDMFGTMLLTHREVLTTATKHSVAWFNSDVDLMSEVMLYGCNISSIGIMSDNRATDTNSKQQLSLFRLNPKAINIDETYWLRDICSDSEFSIIYAYGNTGHYAAPASFGVRPCCAIG